MCKTKIINVCNETTANEIVVNEADTDVHGNNKRRSISLLDKFKDSFVTGSLRIRVNTGRLEIRLIDPNINPVVNPNITVRGSPYRLSEEDRRAVCEKISVLIKAKIIRPSNSPFASPM